MHKKLTGLDGLQVIAVIILVWDLCTSSTISSWGGTALPTLPLPQNLITLLITLVGFRYGYKHTHRHEHHHSHAGAYIRKRAKRILIPYYVYILAACVIFYMFKSSDKILNDGLWFYAIPLGVIPHGSGFMEIAPLSHLWLISVLLLCAILCPLVRTISRKNTAVLSLCLCVAFFLLKCLLYATIGKDSAYRITAYLQLDSLFLGLAAGSAIKLGWTALDKYRNNKIIALVLSVLCLLDGLYSSFIPAPVRTEFQTLLILALILCYSSDNPLASFDNGFWRTLKKASYGIYIWSVAVIMALAAAYNAYKLGEPNFITTIGIYSVVTALTTGIAVLLSSVDKLGEKIKEAVI